MTCERCNGSGIDPEPVPVCCGQGRNGECCGEPVPDMQPCKDCGGHHDEADRGTDGT